MTTRPIPTPETVEEEQTQIEPERLYHLVLIDDDEHTYQYVIEMLAAVFGYGTEKAWTLARIVDTEGRAILYTGAHAECETKQTQVHSYGADPRIPTCKGSMTAVIEDAGAPQS